MTAAETLTKLSKLEQQYLSDCVLLRRELAEHPALLELTLWTRGVRYDQERTELLAGAPREAIEELA
jgi:hypothetical protein